jgi:endonuclease G, mitochondrial
MTDGAESIKQRVQNSPALKAAIEEQVAGGLLERMGVSGVPAGPGGDGALESITSSTELEAIVQRVGRPPLLIQNSAVQLNTGQDDSLADFPPGTDAQIRGTEKDIPSVGRIEFLNFRMGWGGTGWVIAESGADRIVVTNRHVAGLVAKRTVDGRGVFMRDPSQVRYGASIDFKEEFGSPLGNTFTFTVVDIPYLADTTAPDVALLRITGQDLPSALPLAEQEAGLDDLVALIGYPAFDDRNDVDVMAQYFRDLYNVKRYAPGKVMQALSPGIVLRHDCTSLGGNSGSPLIRLSDGAVVGLHYSGVYGVANSAVGVETLRDLLDGKRPVSVRLAAEGVEETLNDGTHQPEDLADREGYEPEFIGTGELEAHWPGLPQAAMNDLAQPSDEIAEKPFEIRYTHFGVRFSSSRRQPVMTAVNIDGLHRVPIKRGNDRWFHDARIPLDIQLSKDDYEDEDIDRGHMVRREDPNWDPSVAAGNPDGEVTPLATQANFDTFHYTNAAVQHGDLNSSSARWLGLEDYILKSSKTHGFRASVFTGPVMRDDDDPIAPGVIAPREFWKVVVMENADTHKLHATAYLLSQGDMIRDLLEKRSKVEGVEGFVLGDFRNYQIAIADLADATGYDFSAYVDADPLTATAGGQEAVATGEPLFLPLDSEDQIVL